MKTYGLTFLIILVFAGFALGQATTANCPTVQVIGPSGVTPFGQNVVFTAKVEPSHNKLTYKWTVTEGTIVDGQGSSSVTVTSHADGVSVIGAVEVFGLPDGCESTALESAPIDNLPSICPFDEWESLRPNGVRNKLDIFFATLTNLPNDTGLIVLRSNTEEKQTLDNPRIQFIVKHAKFRKFDLGRLVFKIEPVERDQSYTVLWVMVKGAELPCPECITYYGNTL